MRSINRVIKLNETVPFKINAFIGIAFLFISIVFGFYIRVRIELENRALEIPNMFSYLDNLPKNLISINNDIIDYIKQIKNSIDSQEVNDLIKLEKMSSYKNNKDANDLNEILKKIRYNPVDHLLYQLVFLFLGFISITIYMCRFIIY